MTQSEHTTPDLPVILHVDGRLPAVDFIRRLHSAGLELRRAEDNSYAVIIRTEEPDENPSTRRQLFQASGVVHAVRSALDCSDHVEIDEVQLASALEAAGRIIDDVAGALETHEEGKHE